MKISILSFILVQFLCLQTAWAQYKIHGTVTDSLTKENIEFCQISILTQKNQLVDFTYSDSVGHYEISLVLPGVYRMQVNSFNYQSIEQEIVIASQYREIRLDLPLNLKSKEMNEVQITAKRSPIIVKEDTVIYDVQHWTQTKDATLEDVLRKIPGFEVSNDGNIKVNGRQIDKILINGEEFLKAGTSLTTRSLTPDMVESVEVRTNEQNDKLKESLLSDKSLVVLDIKLKPSLNKTLFGDAKLATGYQNQMLFGGYANFFALRKKAKFHLLTEFDQFGQQRISLEQLKDIDKEAYLSVFELPADFQELTARAGFEKEIYGFKDYTRFQPGILSLTGKFTPHSNVEMYLGSYNKYVDEEIEINKQQFLTNTKDILSFFNTQKHRQITSKNKFEVKYDYRSKFRLTLNTLYNLENHQTDDLNTQFNNVQTGTNLPSNGSNLALFFYDANRHNRSKTAILSLKSEYRFSGKIGFHLNTLHTQEVNYNNFILNSDDSNSMMAFGETKNAENLFSEENLVKNDLNYYNITQKQHQKKQHSVVHGFVQMKQKRGNLTLGLRLSQEIAENDKDFFSDNLGAESNLYYSVFAGNTPRIGFRQFMPYASYYFSKGIFSLDSKLGYAFVKLENQNEQSPHELLDYKVRMDFNFGLFDNLSISYKQNVSAFPLHKFMAGYDLVDYQSIGIPFYRNITPQTEEVLEVTYVSSLLQKIGIGIISLGVFGQTYTVDSYQLGEGNIFNVNYNQLSSNYSIGALILTKTFEELPLGMKLESIRIQHNQTQEVGEAQNVTLQSKFYMQTYLEKPFNFMVTGMYQQLKMITKPSEQTAFQDSYAVSGDMSLDILEKKGTFIFKNKYTYFRGAGTADYYDMSFKYKHRFKKWDTYIQIDNILNNRVFLRRANTPLFRLDTQRLTFERFVRAGITFKIR